MKYGVTVGDVERALLLLPDDRFFRPREIYDVAVNLGFRPYRGTTLWNELLKRGWIVRTGVPIFAPEARKFYWQKTPQAGVAA